MSELRFLPKQEDHQEAFGSETTRQYFEHWNDLGLEGNPEMKDAIRRNIIEAEVDKKNTPYFKKFADELGISTEEFKKRLQAKVESMARKSNFFVAVSPEVVVRILHNNRFKSQFETTTGGGIEDLRYRAMIEKRLFGIPEDYDPRLRPKYGFLSDDEHGAVKEADSTGPHVLRQFGNVIVKLKKDRVIKRTTVTFKDSWADFEHVPVSPASMPHFSSFLLYYAHASVVDEKTGSSFITWGAGYVEAQYHGELTPDDIESIHVSPTLGVSPEDTARIRGVISQYQARYHYKPPFELVEY